MILRPSYLHNGISYTGKMTSLYWIRALIITMCLVCSTPTSPGLPPVPCMCSLLQLWMMDLPLAHTLDRVDLINFLHTVYTDFIYNLYHQNDIYFTNYCMLKLHLLVSYRSNSLVENVIVCWITNSFLCSGTISFDIPCFTKGGLGFTRFTLSGLLSSRPSVCRQDFCSL